MRSHMIDVLLFAHVCKQCIKRRANSLLILILGDRLDRSLEFKEKLRALFWIASGDSCDCGVISAVLAVMISGVQASCANVDVDKTKAPTK